MPTFTLYFPENFSAKQRQSAVHGKPSLCHRSFTQGPAKIQKGARSDLTLKSCHWDGSSGQRRISNLPLNHADKCWAQQVYWADWWPCSARYRGVENLSMAQRNWSDLSEVTQLFTHTGKHCENSVTWPKGSAFITTHFFTYLAQTLGGGEKMWSM